MQIDQQHVFGIVHISIYYVVDPAAESHHCSCWQDCWQYRLLAIYYIFACGSFFISILFRSCKEVDDWMILASVMLTGKIPHLSE